MEFKLKEAAVCADREFEMIKITPEVRAFVEESGIENGLVYVITEHTTTGITVNESLDCVEKDIMECLSRIAPEDYPYHHNHYLPTYGTIGGNTPGHLKSLLTGAEAGPCSGHLFLRIRRNQNAPLYDIRCGGKEGIEHEAGNCNGR